MRRSQRMGAWLARVESSFVAPRLRGDPAAARKAGVVAGFSFVPLAFVPLLALMEWVAFPPEVAWKVVLLVLGMIPVFASVPFVLRLTGSTRVAGNVMIAYGWLLLGVVSWYSGGPGSPPSFWHVLVPMSAIALVGRPWAVFWTAVVLVEAVVVIWLARNGVTFENRIQPEWRPMYWFASIANLATWIMLAGLVYERSKDVALHTLESANRELARARDDADRASGAKTDFLAILTHEIRTPMTAILGFADVLYDEWRERGFQSREIDALVRIQRAGRELLETINDLLDLSKMEAGKLELERIAFSPSELVAGVIEPLRARAQARGLELSLELGSPLPGVVQSDPARLRQVAAHLVQNALGFTSQGEVRVSLGVADCEGGKCLDLRVRDTGPGIAPERVATLFQPGAPRVTAPSDQARGLGLGLAMCKRLTELLGGRIEVSSELGRGTEFRVLVPIDAPQGGAWPAGQGAVPTLPAHILVVDDGPDNLRLIKHLLTRAGATVVTAADGREALARVEESERDERRFDVVLMDMQMPVLDGYAATRELRRRGFARPILALTAHAVHGTRESCLEAGCDDFATKPVDREELYERIRRLCPDILSRRGE